MNPELRAFIETLIIEAHGADIAKDSKEDIITDLYPRLEESLSLAMLAKLSPEQLETVEAMAQNDTPQEKIQEFLMEVVPDHSTVLQEALRDFWALYIIPQTTTEKTR